MVSVRVLVPEYGVVKIPIGLIEPVQGVVAGYRVKIVGRPTCPLTTRVAVIVTTIPSPP